MNSIIICWPDSQKLMELYGFRENCWLINGERGLDTYGSSAYLVDKDWYDEYADSPFVEDDEYEDYDDELQIAFDDDLIELGFLDEEDEYDEDEDDEDAE